MALVLEHLPQVTPCLAFQLGPESWPTGGLPAGNREALGGGFGIFSLVPVVLREPPSPLSLGPAARGGGRVPGQKPQT